MFINTYWTREKHVSLGGRGEDGEHEYVCACAFKFISFFWRRGGLIWNSTTRTTIIYSTWWKMSKAALCQVPFLFWHQWLRSCIYLAWHASASPVLARWSVFPTRYCSGYSFAVVNEVAVLASTPHLFSAANNAQPAAKLPCPTIYKLHTGRKNPGGQLASVRKERDL